jgi:hypothetical protein
MLTECVLVLLFILYGVTAVWNMFETYTNYGFIIKDSECESVYYCNFVNSILGILLSLFVVVFLILQGLCKNVMSCKVSFSITKLIVLLAFVGVNIWNLIELLDNDTCYLKYKIKNYNLGYLTLLGATLTTLVINSLCCSNKKTNEDNNDGYDEITD